MSTFIRSTRAVETLGGLEAEYVGIGNAVNP